MTNTLPTPFPNPLPPVDESNPPPDHIFTEGKYRSRADGEEYLLAIHPPNCAGQTHTLKNSEHFWQGVEAQFQELFEKI